MEKERQDLLNENIRVHEESHNLVSGKNKKDILSLHHSLSQQGVWASFGHQTL